MASAQVLQQPQQPLSLAAAMSSIPIYASPAPVPCPPPHQTPSVPHAQPSIGTGTASASGKREPAGGYTFAFARVKGELCLVQVSSSTPVSALTPLDIKLFRHEFISIFRFAGARTLHPADIAIVEPIDERLTKYEEENETVFLARGVMERMRRLSGVGVGGGRTRYAPAQRTRQR
ncbi:unnamed protein product [Cyclocybe aegerita]|uniref:Uncharacterized protein n=1 Tax=Cyclocybe aegerita TaxID=1973307 RepID=A0A8S0XQC9_CYCAE|nr:unnamed protein product [Cyclocybe aegerita]